MSKRRGLVGYFGCFKFDDVKKITIAKYDKSLVQELLYDNG